MSDGVLPLARDASQAVVDDPRFPWPAFLGDPGQVVGGEHSRAFFASFATDSERLAYGVAVETYRQDRLVAARMLRTARAALRSCEQRTATIKEKFLGAILGCAVGDALGVSNEFRPWGTFRFSADYFGQSRWPCRPGDWTDDTSNLLCLIDTLISNNGEFLPSEFRTRLEKWIYGGENTPYGIAFGAGRQTRNAIEHASHFDDRAAGNGCLMRLAPAALVQWKSIEKTRKICAASAAVTHPGTEAVQLCELFGEMLARAVGSTGNKADVWSVNPDDYSNGQARRLAGRCWQEDLVPSYENNGYSFNTLRAVLWCFEHSESFDECVFLAANLGDDADTTGAIAGQLAGCYYGVNSIRPEWLENLTEQHKIRDSATKLYTIAVSGKGGSPGYTTFPAPPTKSQEEISQVQKKIRLHVKDGRKRLAGASLASSATWKQKHEEALVENVARQLGIPSDTNFTAIPKWVCISDVQTQHRRHGMSATT